LTLAAGATFGPYRIIEPLGRGGMASVYKAYEPALDRYIALKVLPPEFLHDETFAERFRREAKGVARLEHPNIVPIYAFDIERGIPWMAMRLVPGGALSSLVKRGRLEPGRAVAILKGAADALTYAHAKGVVHRDVKPQNILLDEHERVYLADFGIARMLDGSNKLTATGMISGTPQYMAPEQATGTAVDGRADIYALGIVTYELLTGRVPFSADTPVAVLMKHVQDPIPLPSPAEVKEPLVRAVLKALAKKPEDRWPTAAAFVSALEAALHEDPAVKALPTLAATIEVAAATEPATTAVSPKTRPAVTRPAGPVTEPSSAATGPTRPAPTPEPPTVAAPRSHTTALAAAIGFGGVAALVLAGVVAFWLLRRPSAEGQSEDPSLRPAETTVARGPETRSALAPASPHPADASSAGASPATSPPTAAAPVSLVPPPPTVIRPATVTPTAVTVTSVPTQTTQPAPARAAPPPSTAPPAPAPATIGPSPEVEALIQGLGDRRVETRWKSAETLGNLGADAAPAIGTLVAGLRDTHEVVRWRTAEALGKIGTVAVVGPLSSALKDRDSLVRTEAAKALGTIGPPAREAVPALGAALSDTDVYCRRQAAKALVAMAKESAPAVPALVQGLKDKDKFVRLQSAKALGGVGPAAREAVPALTAATRDEEPLVARAATEALKRIAGDGSPAS
jgi:eukaryotic-like serine/threonine-protein kinase